MASSGPASAQAPPTPFRPALIVVDMQEDFCPPNGSLAVNEARTLAPIINSLLSLPGFVVKISTQDFHPPNHISFATNHPPPNNVAFESFVEMQNPNPNPPGPLPTIDSTTSSTTDTDTETDIDTTPRIPTKPQRLWPPHCIANTPGACIIPELSTSQITVSVRKGQDARVEMYSAFADAFGNCDCVASGGVNVDLLGVLREQRVTDLFVVGVAGDYCVKDTAVDAARRGVRVWVVREGVRCVDEGGGWERARGEMRECGVGVVGVEGREVGWVRERGEGRGGGD
ncbi:hypothetical protein FQN50_006554 [Emmonsiellopsis sp. PD_5]|nr:hypothetical protein FQN50_006554 [Emmonsiellopsis sp. PD_5]